MTVDTYTAFHNEVNDVLPSWEVVAIGWPVVIRSARIFKSSQAATLAAVLCRMLVSLKAPH